MSIQVTTFGYRMRKQKITYLITYPLYDTFMGWQTNPLMDFRNAWDVWAT